MLDVSVYINLMLYQDFKDHGLVHTQIMNAMSVCKRFLSICIWSIASHAWRISVALKFSVGISRIVVWCWDGSWMQSVMGRDFSVSVTDLLHCTLDISVYQYDVALRLWGLQFGVWTQIMNVIHVGKRLLSLCTWSVASYARYVCVCTLVKRLHQDYWIAVWLIWTQIINVKHAWKISHRFCS
jgi:hypothetical protein